MQSITGLLSFCCVLTLIQPPLASHFKKQFTLFIHNQMPAVAAMHVVKEPCLPSYLSLCVFCSPLWLSDSRPCPSSLYPSIPLYLLSSWSLWLVNPVILTHFSKRALPWFFYHFAFEGGHHQMGRADQGDKEYVSDPLADFADPGGKCIWATSTSYVSEYSHQIKHTLFVNVIIKFLIRVHIAHTTLLLIATPALHCNVPPFIQLYIDASWFAVGLYQDTSCMPIHAAVHTHPNTMSWAQFWPRKCPTHMFAELQNDVQLISLLLLQQAIQADARSCLYR